MAKTIQKPKKKKITLFKNVTPPNRGVDKDSEFEISALCVETVFNKN